MGPSGRNTITTRPTTNTPPASAPNVSQQQAAGAARNAITPLVAWAVEHGMAPDSPETIDAIVKWAAAQGCKGKTLDDVMKWASAKGYKQSSFTEVLELFRRAGATIRMDAGETPIADEGEIETKPLENVRPLRPRCPVDVLAQNLAHLRAMLSTPQGIEDAMAIVRTVNQEIARGPAPGNVRGVDARALAAVSSGIAADPNTANEITLVERFTPLVRRGVDVDALVQAVLRESYLEVMRDLADQASRAKFYNDLKKLMRSELEQAREKLAASPTDADVGQYVPLSFDLKPTYGPDGQPLPAVPVPGETPLTTKAELAAYVENLESQLKTVGDDAQLASIDFQNTLQKQSQLIQTLSAISKLLHTTATSIIQKLA
jgi:hypothetical protein